ncbi:MAG: HAMP domain-containing sensor histidine kinase [Ignavibacteriaceae bacterium]|jgi:two-component system phosphate regulon sensor histidine kinase PhoR
MFGRLRKIDSYFYSILIFVLAQLAWMGLLGLWIYWYVSNSIIFEQVGDQLSPQILVDSPSIFIFVGGIILLAAIEFVMSVIFRNLNVQLRLRKLYDNFIANVTHELKSPLASIQLYLETLKSRELSSGQIEKFTDFMLKDAGRLNNLINSILEISRLEQKKIAHDYHVFDGAETIRSLVLESAGQIQLSSENISINGNSSAKIVIDKNAFKIVIDNLIDNAIKYTTGKPEINVVISDFKKWFVVELSDKGIGIEPHQLKKVFKKFYRITDLNIPNVKGTGLGLYWVREILKSHGGKITCLSNGINTGTKFKIELPVYKRSHKHLTERLLKLTSRREEKEGREKDYE